MGWCYGRAFGVLFEVLVTVRRFCEIDVGMLSLVLFEALVTVRCFRKIDALGVLFGGAGAGAFLRD